MICICLSQHMFVCLASAKVFAESSYSSFATTCHLGIKNSSCKNKWCLVLQNGRMSCFGSFCYLYFGRSSAALLYYYTSKANEEWRGLFEHM